jgi:hypothetical protein
MCESYIVVELAHAAEQREDGAAEGGGHDAVAVGAVGVHELTALVTLIERERLSGRRAAKDGLVSHIGAPQIDHLRPVRADGRVARLDHLRERVLEAAPSAAVIIPVSRLLLLLRLGVGLGTSKRIVAT